MEGVDAERKFTLVTIVIPSGFIIVLNDVMTVSLTFSQYYHLVFQLQGNMCPIMGKIRSSVS